MYVKFAGARKDGAPRRDVGRGAWTWVLGLDCFARLAMTVRRDVGRKT
ncbi:MAG: hypothetical protein LBM98_10160 [Oscillospiraceae bacterium]|nr:hypothetical protein [Oscillospiraceae bacterium]